MLSEKRDMEAAQAFFFNAIAVTEKLPERVTTDGHSAYPRAITEVLGTDVQHRVSDCLTNRRLAGPSREQAALPSNVGVWGI